MKIERKDSFKKITRYNSLNKIVRIKKGDEHAETSLADRFDEIESGVMNEVTREVCVTFSTENPVKITRWLDEVLLHDEGSVDLTYCDGQFPSLWNHDINRMVGIVLKSAVVQRKGKAVVKVRDDEVWRGIWDGYYRYCSVRGDPIEDSWEELGEGKVRRIISSWKVKEITFTPMPADDGAGVGRSEDFIKFHRENDMRFNNIIQRMDKEHGAEGPGGTGTSGAGGGGNPPPKPPESSGESGAGDSGEIQRSGASGGTGSGVHVDDKRANQMYKLCNVVKRMDLLGKYLGDPKLTFEDLQNEIERSQTSDSDNSSSGGRGSQYEAIGMDAKEISQFRIVRAIDAMLSGRKGNELEYDAMETIRSQVGSYSNSIPIPPEVLRAGPLAAGAAGKGEELVQTSIQHNSFIDLLQNETAVKRLGARFLTGLSDKLQFAEKTSTLVAQFVDEENEDVPVESATAFKSRIMDGKRLVGSEKYSKRLIKQTSWDVEKMIREDIATQFALGVDLNAIGGQEKGPKGVLDVINGDPKIKATNFIDAGDQLVSNEHVIALETAVAKRNGRGRLAYICGASMRGYLKGKQVSSADPTKIWKSSKDNFGEINGYPGFMTNQVGGADQAKKHLLIYGAWDQIIVGFWGVMEILLDPYGSKSKYMVEVVANQDVDILVRYPGSFAYLLGKISEESA